VRTCEESTVKSRFVRVVERESGQPQRLIFATGWCITRWSTTWRGPGSGGSSTTRSPAGGRARPRGALAAALILFHEPTENCRLRGAPRADFLRLPAHRTLFRASAGCGLPIGNQTSQFGANVYLDALDQFIKHELKARYYVRYCDDMVLLSADAAEFAAWERRIARLLDERLRLRLNDRRKLRPVARFFRGPGRCWSRCGSGSDRTSHILTGRRATGCSLVCG